MSIVINPAVSQVAIQGVTTPTVVLQPMQPVVALQSWMQLVVVQPTGPHAWQCCEQPVT